MRVFHGISGSAGQPRANALAQRRLGIGAKNYILGQNKFAYGADHVIPAGGNQNETFIDLLKQESSNFDVFHFYFRSFFYEKGNLRFPTGIDLLLLRLLDKAVIMNFRGSEVRLHSKFINYSPYNYVAENPDRLVEKFPEEVQRKYIELATAVCSRVLVPDPELQSYVPGSIIVPRAVDLSDWQYIGLKENKKPIVVHAPSRRVVKGTNYILKALEELKAEGIEFDLRLVEEMENEKARELYREADIVIDQIRIGWYGVLAVEAMALGKPVVSYVRDDLLWYFDNEIPLHIANPDNIKERLRILLLDSNLRERLGKAGRAFVEKTHDSNQVAKRLVEIYKDALETPNPVNLEVLLEFFRGQIDIQNKYIKALKKSSLRDSVEVIQPESNLSKLKRGLRNPRLVKGYLKRKFNSTLRYLSQRR